MFRKKKVDQSKIKQAKQNAKERRKLYRQLYEQTDAAKRGRPCPAMPDEWIEDELRRILRTK